MNALELNLKRLVVIAIGWCLFVLISSSGCGPATESSDADDQTEFPRTSKLPIEISILQWNIQSGDNDPAIIAKRLTLLLTTLKSEPDTAVRGQFLSSMPISPAAAQALIANKQLDAMMDFVDQEIHANKRHQVLARLLQSQRIVAALLAESGLEGVMELAVQEKDPTSRGRLLASMLSSSAVRRSRRAGTRPD